MPISETADGGALLPASDAIPSAEIDACRQRLAGQLIDHIPALTRYARVLAGSSDQAEDLVQDCLERALSRAHLYRPDTNPRAWLFTIIRNIALTHMRKLRLRRVYASERRAMTPQIQAPNQFHRIALDQGLDLVARLSPAEREAIVLVAIHELSYDEAADRLGLRVGTLKSRACRGRRRLAILMEPPHTADPDSSSTR